MNAPCRLSLPRSGLVPAKVQQRCSVVTSARKKGGKGFGKPEEVKEPSKAAEVKAPSAPTAYKAQPSTPSTSSPAEDDDDVVPVQITDRMLSRILIFSGLPIFFGLLLFPFFWWLKVIKHVDLPMGTAYVVSSSVFGVGLLGITYGAMSASWVENMEGSKLGWNEFKANLAATMGRMDDEP